MAWHVLFGGFIFWISLILAVILFAAYKKFYPVMYMISVSLYMFTVGFLIDVFNLPKFGVLFVWVFSACLFMLLGYYLSKVLSIGSSKTDTANKLKKK